MSNFEPVLDYISLNANVRSVLAKQDHVLLSQIVAQTVDAPPFTAGPRAVLYRLLLERSGLNAGVLQTTLAAAEDFSQALASTLSPEEMQRLNTVVDLSLQDAEFYRRLRQDLETASSTQLGLSEDAVKQFDALARGPGPHGPTPPPGPHMPVPPWWDMLDYYVQLNSDLQQRVTPKELILLDNLVEHSLQDPAFFNSLNENPATAHWENGISQDLLDRINAVVEERRSRRFTEHLVNIGYAPSDVQ